VKSCGVLVIPELGDHLAGHAEPGSAMDPSGMQNRLSGVSANPMRPD
jgi:hypothetical protein